MQTNTVRFPLPKPEFNFAGFSWPRRVAVLPPKTLKARKERFTGCTGPYYHAPKPVARNAGKGFYLGDAGQPGLRWSWCDDIDLSITHTGWYSEDHCMGECIRGLVFTLPRSRGFLAGWSMGKGMVGSVEYSDVYETPEEAARAADQLAERVAEEEREYQRTNQDNLEDFPEEVNAK